MPTGYLAFLVIHHLSKAVAPAVHAVLWSRSSFDRLHNTALGTKSGEEICGKCGEGLDGLWYVLL